MSSKKLYEMEVQVKASDKDFSKTMKRIANNTKKQAKDLQVKAGIVAPTEDFKRLQKNITDTEQKLKELEAAKKRTKEWEIVDKKGYKDLEKQRQKIQGLLDFERSQQDYFVSQGDVAPGTQGGRMFDDSLNRAEAYEQQLEEIAAKQKDLTAHTASWEKLEAKIEIAKDELDGYRAELAKLEGSKAAYTPGVDTSKIRKLNSYLNEIAKNAKGSVGSAFQSLKERFPGLAENQKLKAISSRLQSLRGRFQAAAGQTSRFRSGLRSIGASGKSDLKPVKSDFNKIGNAIKKTLSPLKKFNLLSNKSGKSLTQLKKGLFLGAGIKPLARLAALGGGVYLAVNGMVEGFKNLSQYSRVTNSDLSMLKGSLITLKNALATAFAPILSVVAPILNKLIQWLTKAATAVAHFFAALTGKSSVVVAKPVSSDFAAGVAETGDAADKAAGSTDKANKSAEKYQKTLLGFDQINKLDDPTDRSGSGSGGSGAGASAGGISPSDMFETVEVSNSASDLAKRIKEAWRKADFTDLGKLIGLKLNTALRKIPWRKIKETSRKIAKSIATFLNGFIEATDWKLVGKTFAEGLNTVIEFGYTFVTTFKWKKFGTAIGNTVNGFFKNADFAKAGKTLSNGIKGIFDTAINAVSTINWSQIGKKIGEIITNIDWVGIIKKALTLAGKAIVGGLDLLTGFIKQLVGGIKKYINSGKLWKDLKNTLKLSIDTVLNVAKALGDLAWAIIDGIADVSITLVINAVKSAWEWVKNTFTNGEGEIDITLGIKRIFQKVKKKAPLAGFLLSGGVANPIFWMGLGIKKVKDKGLPSWLPKEKKKAGRVNIEAEVTKASNKIPLTARILDKFTASLTKKKDSIRDKQVNNFTAGLTKKKDGIKDKQVNNFITGLTNKKDQIKPKAKTLGGFAANLINRLDNIKSSKKTISGFTAKVSKLQLALGVGKKVIDLGTAVIRSTLKKSTGGVFRGGSWHPVQAAASGGAFNQGQMFIAREAGPELVGTIGGHTAVMNNDQIVSSVAAGVARAVAAVMGDQNTTVVLEGDAKKFFRAMQTEADNYINSTGMAPFPV